MILFRWPHSEVFSPKNNGWKWSTTLDHNLFLYLYIITVVSFACFRPCFVAVLCGNKNAETEDRRDGKEIHFVDEEQGRSCGPQRPDNPSGLSSAFCPLRWRDAVHFFCIVFIFSTVRRVFFILFFRRFIFSEISIIGLWALRTMRCVQTPGKVFALSALSWLVKKINKFLEM